MSDSMSDTEMLNYAVVNGIIDTTLVQKMIEMKKKEELLSKHQYSIWQGQNAKWYTYFLSNDGKRILKKRNTKEEIETLVIEYVKSILEVPTIEAIFEKWSRGRLDYGDIKKQTYDRYKTDLYRFYKPRGMLSRDIRYISSEELEDFIKRTIRDNGLNSKAYSGLRTITRGIFKYAKRHGYTNISVTQFFGDMEISKNAFAKNVKIDEKEVFTDCEVQKIQDYIMCHQTILNLGILFAFMTGLRVGELCVLQKTDLNENILTINKTEVHYRDNEGRYVFEVRDCPKTDAGFRKVILGKDAISLFNAIKRRNPFGEYLFLNKDERIKGKSFTARLYAICKKLGIPKRSMHKVRKTYGTKLLNAKVDDTIIMKQMGHTDISCTKKYYYYNNKSLDEATNQIEKAVSYR